MAEPVVCSNHMLRQHPDGRRPWCDHCGRDDSGTHFSEMKVEPAFGGGFNDTPAMRELKEKMRADYVIVPDKLAAEFTMTSKWRSVGHLLKSYMHDHELKFETVCEDLGINDDRLNLILEAEDLVFEEELVLISETYKIPLRSLFEIEGTYERPFVQPRPMIAGDVLRDPLRPGAPRFY